MSTSETHLFYTQCGSDEKPVPGAQAVPLSLIVTVTTPAWRHNFDGHGGSLCFDVIGQGFNWTCWSTSDEATKSMHRDLMERWSALHRPEAAPPNTIERDQLKAELATMKVSLAAAEEALTCLGYQRAAHGPGWSPPQLSAGATMIVNATVYAYQAKAQKLEEECQTFRQERDQLKAAYEDLGRYIRDIFEQETDEKEGEHRNDIKSMIRYLLVDKAGEQRTRARQVAQERDQAKMERNLMEVRCAEINTERDRLLAETARLEKFKAYVHDRLDKMGVPFDPDSPHKAAGCRIGGRLDWAEAQWGFQEFRKIFGANPQEIVTRLQDEIDQLKAERDQLKDSLKSQQDEIERDQLKVERDRLMKEARSSDDAIVQVAHERDQLKAAYEDLGRYIRDIFEQETGEDGQETLLQDMIRYLLVDKAGEQRTLAWQVAQEREKLKVSLKSQQDQIEQQASSLRERWAQIEKLATERDLARQHEARAVANLAMATTERDRLKADLDTAEARFNDHLREIQNNLQALLKTEGDKAIAEISAKEGEIRKHIDSLTAERDKALEQVRQMEIERDHIAGVDGSDAKAEIAQLTAKHEAEFAEVVARLDGLTSQRNKLEADLSKCVQQAYDVLSGIAARTVHPLDFVKAEVWCSKWVSKIPIKVNTQKFQDACEAIISTCDKVLEQAPVNIPQFTVVGKPDHPQQTSTGEYITDGGEKYTATGEVLSKNPPGVDAPRTPLGQKIAELSARIPADQKGLSLDQINAEVGRSDADPYKAAVDRGRNYTAGMIVSTILGCEPAQFTDRHNPDHLRVLVDLLPIMRMDRSPGGWGEIAAGFDRTAAEKEAEKRAAIQAAQKPSKPAPKEYTLVHELPVGTTAKTAREMGLSVRPDIPDHATYRTGGEWITQ